MADDWNVGDLARCIDDSPCRGCGGPLGVKLGATYRVLNVMDAELWPSLQPIVLIYGGWPACGHAGWLPGRRFTKDNPTPEADFRSMMRPKTPELQPA